MVGARQRANMARWRQSGPNVTESRISYAVAGPDRQHGRLSRAGANDYGDGSNRWRVARQRRHVPRLFFTAVRSASIAAPAPHSSWKPPEKMRKFIAMMLVTVALSACGGRKPLESTPRLAVVKDSGALPAPDRNDLTAADRPSLIGPLDTIQV
jgi:predicted small lipoprotein YifL